MMIMLSHPHPQSEFLMPKPQPLSHPPHKKSKMIIQMKELHPHPLLAEAVPHPHPVAVKSLIIASKRFCLCFIICGMACMCLQVI